MKIFYQRIANNIIMSCCSKTSDPYPESRFVHHKRMKPYYHFCISNQLDSFSILPTMYVIMQEIVLHYLPWSLKMTRTKKMHPKEEVMRMRRVWWRMWCMISTPLSCYFRGYWIWVVCWSSWWLTSNRSIIIINTKVFRWDRPSASSSLCFVWMNHANFSSSSY